MVLLIISTTSKAQQPFEDTLTYRESKVDALFSFYNQDGKHSAVTGGKGSEKLQVYSTKITGTHELDEKGTLYLYLGVDVISSASTDSIDFELSSASRVDQHTSLSIGYSRQVSTEYEIGGNLYFSIESDYFSRGGEAWMQFESKDQRKAASLSFSAYFDDLRWGRLQPPYIIEARNLIYPVELRDSAWFDIHHRNSYNLSATYRYDINKRMSLSFFPAYSFQEGLLSTPFHRVFLQNEARPVVENLPTEKHMGVLGIGLNSFLASNLILRAYAQYYLDNFGLSSTLLKLELPIKLSPKINLIPGLRGTLQQGSKYFAPYQQHLRGEQFYTSDYDLSNFWSVSPGMAVSINMTKPRSPNWQLQQWSIRYRYYHREDGLKAHVITTYWNIDRNKTKVLAPY